MSPCTCWRSLIEFIPKFTANLISSNDNDDNNGSKDSYHYKDHYNSDNSYAVVTAIILKSMVSVVVC